MNLSMFSHSHFSPIGKTQNHVEEVDAGKKTRRRTCDSEIEADDEFGIKEPKSVSDAGFGCNIQPWELQNAKLKFRSFRHRETDSANTKSTHGNKVEPSQLAVLQRPIPQERLIECTTEIESSGRRPDAGS